MWILYAVGSAFFAGITVVLAKCGIQKTDSDVATAIRTIVVLAFSWLMVLLTGTWTDIGQISRKTFVFWFYQDLPQEHRGCVITKRCRRGLRVLSFP